MVLIHDAETRTAHPMWSPQIKFALTQRDLDVEIVWPQRRGARLHRLLTGSTLPPQDKVKLWDAANVHAMVSDTPRHHAVLDCGAYNSPVPLLLNTMGFTSIHSIDLNPHMTSMPSGSNIVSSCQNIVATSFADNTFDLVTCCSTIEHGVDWNAFLCEAARLLRPRGRLYISTDLIPDSAPNNEGSAFRLPWWPLRPHQLTDHVELLTNHGFMAPDVPAVTLPDTLPVEFLGQPLAFVAFETQLRDAR